MEDFFASVLSSPQGPSALKTLLAYFGPQFAPQLTRAPAEDRHTLMMFDGPGLKTSTGELSRHNGAEQQGSCFASAIFLSFAHRLMFGYNNTGSAVCHALPRPKTEYIKYAHFIFSDIIKGLNG